MKTEVDKSIYTDRCISKAVYSMSREYTFSRKSDGSVEHITIISKSGQDVDDSVANKFIDALNDYKLRDIIEKETHDIRVILYAKAFGDFDNIDEQDIEDE